MCFLLGVFAFDCVCDCHSTTLRPPLYLSQAALSAADDATASAAAARDVPRCLISIGLLAKHCKFEAFQVLVIR